MPAPRKVDIDTFQTINNAHGSIIGFEHWEPTETITMCSWAIHADDVDFDLLEQLISR
jgi:hypothetical protein